MYAINCVQESNSTIYDALEFLVQTEKLKDMVWSKGEEARKKNKMKMEEEEEEEENRQTQKTNAKSWSVENESKVTTVRGMRTTKSAEREREAIYKSV